MKGITHFISGIAVATFVPHAVHQAMTGSLILALGGLCGLLPDTLDFKLLRYLPSYDLEIAPQAHDMQPQAIADKIAQAMRKADKTKKAQTIKLHTVRLGVDLWREYSLRFKPSSDEVIVRVGPVVNTSLISQPEQESFKSQEEGHANTHIVGKDSKELPFLNTYAEETKINIFDGPSWRFEPVLSNAPSEPQARLRIIFLPWHRRWTHSLTVAAATGLGLGLLVSPSAGWVSGLSWATHVLQDQLGHMGANLLWPFTRRRSPGLRIWHSGDSLPNFATCWLALALIIFNLDRFSDTPRLPSGPYLLLTMLLPLLLIGVIDILDAGKGSKSRPQRTQETEIISETED